MLAMLFRLLEVCREQSRNMASSMLVRHPTGSGILNNTKITDFMTTSNALASNEDSRMAPRYSRGVELWLERENWDIEGLLRCHIYFLVPPQ